MITQETAAAYLAKINDELKADPNYVMKLLARFCADEPNFTALNAMFHSTMVMADPSTAALASLAFYHELTRRQKSSDELNDQLGSG